MKRLMLIFIILLIIPNTAFAQSNQYDEYLSTFDLSFTDELSSDTYHYLENLNLNNFSYDEITNFNISNLSELFMDMAIKRLNTPLKSCSIVLVLVLLSALLKSLKTDELSDTYSTISAVAICVAILTSINSTLKLANISLSTASNFIYAFIPTFCAIVAVGGGVTTSFSTNSTLLLLSQGLSFISSNLFLPITNSFLAISVCSGLRSELNLSSFLSTVKRMITSSIAFISAMFISILSIKTAVASRSDILGIRSVRFLINTVVPVIGGSISEGLLSIQSYSSLIKSSVGIVGIISVALVFLPAIIEVVLWRITLSICSIASDIFGDKSVSMMINAFRDTLLIINVILILSMVTTIISIGILIATRTA